MKINKQQLNRDQYGAVSYIRVSSQEQKNDGYSLDAQEKLVADYGRRIPNSLAENFHDVETAKRAGRKGFSAMLEFLEANPNIRHVVVEKIDRLFRNWDDFFAILRFRVWIHAVKEGEIYGPDSKSCQKLFLYLRVLLSVHVVENLSEETIKGQTEKAEQGYYPSRAPNGFRNIIEPGGRKNIEQDPVQADIISRIFHRFATGNYSFKQMTQWATDEGVVIGKKLQRIFPSTIQKILQNPVYMGSFRWGGKIYEGKIPGSEGARTYKPIVSQEIWFHVQEIIRMRQRSHARKHNFAFAGFIRCGYCDCALTGEIKKGKYVYYHCTGNKGKHQEPYVREDLLSQRFRGYLISLQPDQELLAFIKEAFLETEKQTKQQSVQRIAMLRSQLARVQSRLDKMFIQKLDGELGVEKDDFARLELEFMEERTHLEILIQQLEGQQRNYLHEGVKLIELLQNVVPLYDRQNAREKRRLLNFVCSNSTWKGGELHTELRQPFDLIANMKRPLERAESAEGAKTAKLNLAEA